MTIYEYLSIGGSLLGTIVVVASLIYVRRQTAFLAEQTKMQSRTMINNIYMTLEASILDIDVHFITHNEVRPFFYDGKDISKRDSQELQRKIQGVAELLLDYFDHVLTLYDLFSTQQKQLFITPDDESRSGLKDYKKLLEFKENWDKWIKEMFSTSPVLRRYFEENTKWYIPELKKLYEESPKTNPDDGE
ncbi:MAG TPA: hypothetical protein VMC09_10875 [Anaerolineales bacterium]|nr:hypothetical protein [Anaerolineales bacterium]